MFSRHLLREFCSWDRRASRCLKICSDSVKCFFFSNVFSTKHFPLFLFPDLRWNSLILLWSSICKTSFWYFLFVGLTNIDLSIAIASKCLLLFLVKNVGCLFNPDFQAFCPDFRNFSQISGLLTRLSANEIFGCTCSPCTPAFYTTGWGLPQAWTVGPPMSKMLHLILNIYINKTVHLFWQCSWKHISAAWAGGFGGLSSPNKVTSAPKLNYETVQISGVFVNL